MATAQITFFSTSLHRLVPLTAVIPAEAGPPGSKPRPKKLPALYMLHGYTGISTDWLFGSPIQELANQLGVAVFCPSGENSFYLDDADGGNNYATFVGQELVDFSRRLFPLSSKKEDTAIAGLSMGGYGALRNGLYYHKTFGAIFAFSSALFIDRMAAMKPGENDGMGNGYAYFERWFGSLKDLPGSDKDPYALAKNYAEKHGKLPHMYIACGTQDMGIASNRDYGKFLKKLPGETLYEEWPGEHNWTFWQAAIGKALVWWEKIRETT